MATSKKIKLSSIKPNPDNPRLIKDEKFKQLCQSIKDLPKMMELRPIIVDENNIVQGGNMRLKALQELGYKEIPETWVKQAKDFTPEELKEFIIKDNVGFGEWEWDALANEWDLDLIQNWGLEIPDFLNDEEAQPEESSGYDQQQQWFLNIRCDNEQQTQELYERFINEGLEVKIVT